MPDESSSDWRNYTRPLALAAVFTVSGNAEVFVAWELHHHQDGDVVVRLLWVAAAALIMAVTIGVMVGFIVGGRYEGLVAGVISSFCYGTVLVGGILASYELDVAIDLFGVEKDPELFILTVVVPTLLTTPLYGWLLHSKVGNALLARVGL